MERHRARARRDRHRPRAHRERLQGDLEYRRRQLRQLQEEVVDIEDMDTGVNIMDLGLNDFRQDLLAYAKEHPDVEHTPLRNPLL